MYDVDAGIATGIGIVADFLSGPSGTGVGVMFGRLQKESVICGRKSVLTMRY